MKISRVVVGTSDVAAVTDFHRSVLRLPVLDADARATTIGIGPATVRYEQRPAFAGAHHLAYGVAPEDFDRARDFLAGRVEVLPAGGDEVVLGPEGWDSRSIYFRGPGGLVMEYIAHSAHQGMGSSSDVPALLGVAEVGVGVTDVRRAVADLTRWGLQPFPPQEAEFAPVGDVDGMIIVVQQDRQWFPEGRHAPAQDPVAITLRDAVAAAATTSVPGATITVE